jgi:hypothetical protein
MARLAEFDRIANMFSLARYRRFRVFVVLFCGCAEWAAAPARAQTVPGPSDQPAQRYDVQGTVVNSATGEPVRRALVQTYGAPPPRNAVLSDGEGHFELRDLPAGEFTIQASKPGFFSPQQIAQNGAPPVQSSVRVGPAMDPVVLKLVPEGVVFGHVESDGEAAEGIPVGVFAMRISDGRKRWEQRAVTTTDEDGGFRLPGLPPGAYYLAAGPSWKVDLGAFAGKHQSACPREFYPGAREIQDASLIQLDAGQQMEADFSLRAEPAYEVSGSIASAAGANLQLMDAAGEQLSPPTQFNPQTGVFKTFATAGSYTLRAQAWKPGGVMLRGEQPLVVQSKVSGIRIALTPSIAIPVNVRTESESAASSQPEIAHPTLVSVRLRSTALTLNNLEYYADAGRNPASPELAVRGIEPGRYSVEIRANSNWYVASAESGATDLLRDDLTVPSGGDAPPIEIVLRNDGGAMKANIVSAGQAASGVVLLIPARSPGDPFTSFAYQGNGAQFTNLPPGDYDALAFDRVDGLEYTNPDVMELYSSRATQVTITPNHNTEITLEMIHAAR